MVLLSKDSDSMLRYTLNDMDFEDAPYRPTDPFFDDYDDEDYIQDDPRMSLEQLTRIRKDMLAFINDMLAELEEVEPSLRDIVANRYPLQHGYAQINDEIGVIFGCTEQNIRITLKKAIIRLGKAQFYSTVHDIVSGLGYESTKALEQGKEKVHDLVADAVPDKLPAVEKLLNRRCAC